MKNSLVYIFLLVSILVSAQNDSDQQLESTAVFSKEELKKEQNLLNFKSNFFDALSENSKEDYDKALEHLAVCEKIDPDNIATIFEKAKNYFYLKHYLSALDYCEKGLAIAPDNYWLLNLQKDIYLKQNNYDEAIITQKKMYNLKKQASEGLLRLYYYTKNEPAGRALLDEIETKNISITAIDFYQKYFNQKAQKKVLIQDSKKDISQVNTLEELRDQFFKDKTFNTLKKLLKTEKISQNYQQLLKDSKEGLAFFPAQAVIYWYHGLALQNLDQNKKAIQVLETGLDFVMDDTILLNNFYNVLIKSYKAIDNQHKVNHYKQLVQKLQKQ